MDILMRGHLRPTLLGRLGGVDLKIDKASKKGDIMGGTDYCGNSMGQKCVVLLVL